MRNFFIDAYVKPEKCIYGKILKMMCLQKKKEKEKQFLFVGWVSLELYTNDFNFLHKFVGTYGHLISLALAHSTGAAVEASDRVLFMG